MFTTSSTATRDHLTVASADATKPQFHDRYVTGLRGPRAARIGDGDVDHQITRAYRLAFARTPAPEEAAAARRLIEGFGLLAFCRVLFNTNEFVYVH